MNSVRENISPRHETLRRDIGHNVLRQSDGDYVYILRVVGWPMVLRRGRRQHEVLLGQKETS